MNGEGISGRREEESLAPNKFLLGFSSIWGEAEAFMPFSQLILIELVADQEAGRNV